jgi:sugar lactone lactonase YvrE
MRTKLFVSLAVLLIVSLIPASILADRPLGDSNLIAPVTGAGLPEGIVTHGSRFYVSGPAGFGLDRGSAYVHAYDIKTGALVETYPINIFNPYVSWSAASCAAFGPDGKLYVIEPFVGVIAMDLDANNTQSVYSAFEWSFDVPSLLNDLAFDDNGNLYVTDTFAATIYRVPAGGGAPAVWFWDPRLAGNELMPFGVNGIRIDKNNQMAYVSVTVDAAFDGKIYRLPLVDNPDADDLELFASLHFPLPDDTTMSTGPDGIAFGKSGKLYVAEAVTSSIAVLNPDGSVEARYFGPEVPWANPANIAFNDKEGALLVTNHASLVEPLDPDLYLVFDVYVNDKGQPLN